MLRMKQLDRNSALPKTFPPARRFSVSGHLRAGLRSVDPGRSEPWMSGRPSHHLPLAGWCRAKGESVVPAYELSVFWMCPTAKCRPREGMTFLPDGDTTRSLLVVYDSASRPQLVRETAVADLFPPAWNCNQEELSRCSERKAWCQVLQTRTWPLKNLF